MAMNKNYIIIRNLIKEGKERWGMRVTFDPDISTRHRFKVEFSDDENDPWLYVETQTHYSTIYKPAHVHVQKDGTIVAIEGRANIWEKLQEINKQAYRTRLGK